MNIRYNHCLFLLLLVALIQNSVMGNFGGGSCNNAGTMSLNNSCFRVRETFNNTGKVIAEEVNECVCGTLVGNGLFKGHTIKIVAKDFQFKGTIECDGECQIITAKPFDHSICTFKGNGNFVFIVDENAYGSIFPDEVEEVK